MTPYPEAQDSVYVSGVHEPNYFAYLFGDKLKTRQLVNAVVNLKRLTLFDKSRLNFISCRVRVPNAYDLGFRIRARSGPVYTGFSNEQRPIGL